MSQPMQPGQDFQSSDSNIVPVCISYPNRARMFDPNITLDELLGPDSTGGDRIDMIIDMYCIGVPDITPCYYNSGEKTFVTHEQNDRDTRYGTLNCHVLSWSVELSLASPVRLVGSTRLATSCLFVCPAGALAAEASTMHMKSIQIPSSQSKS